MLILCNSTHRIFWRKCIFWFWTAALQPVYLQESHFPHPPHEATIMEDSETFSQSISTDSCSAWAFPPLFGSKLLPPLAHNKSWKLVIHFLLVGGVKALLKQTIWRAKPGVNIFLCTLSQTATLQTQSLWEQQKPAPFRGFKERNASLKPMQSDTTLWNLSAALNNRCYESVPWTSND